MLPHLGLFCNSIVSSITTAWRGPGADRWHSLVRPCLVAVAQSARYTGRTDHRHTTRSPLVLPWTIRLFHEDPPLTPLVLASRLVWSGDAQRRARGVETTASPHARGRTRQPTTVWRGGAQFRATPRTLSSHTHTMLGDGGGTRWGDRSHNFRRHPRTISGDAPAQFRATPHKVGRQIAQFQATKWPRRRLFSTPYFAETFRRVWRSFSTPCCACRSNPASHPQEEHTT
jgi:hypothetical protein